MNRKIYYWKLRGSEMQLGERTLIMGVLNVTPDSFSDGGRFNDPDRAYARALELEEQGADIIDIGAESTKPGSHRITADEEWQRLVPVLKRLRGNLRVPLSLDTYKSEIAERALEYGVEIFNDPSGLTFDPHLAKVAAVGNAGLILNHMRGLPESWAKMPPMQDPVGTIARELDATAGRARHAGVERGRIVIDPGLGFGKRKEQNAEILAHLQQLAALDFPILVGPSRKSFLAQPSETGTLYGTAAAVAAAVLNGAHIVRVHDVKEMQSVVQVAEEIARAAVPKPVLKVDDRTVVRAHTRTGPNFEAERPRPPRPPVVRQPIAKPPAVTPTEEEPIRPAANKSDSRPKYPDRDKRDGSRPPVSRPFTPSRGRDFRPGQGAAAGKERFNPKGSKRPFVREGDRPPRPSGFKPKGPKPTFDRRDDKREGRPERGSGPPRSGPPRSGPPRSGPPRSGPPRSGPPRSGPPRSGPPRSGPPRSGPPRGDRPGGRPAGPPKRPFRKRP
jgi:dihydropteroate synthase